MSPGFSASISDEIVKEMVAAYDFNIQWYKDAAHFQRALHYVLGIWIILGQVATLSSFAFEMYLPKLTSPILAGMTSALIAVFGFLSPTAKWRDFRTAQHELMAQRLLFRLDMNSADDSNEQRNVVTKYVDAGMRVVNATATSYWRQVTKSTEQLRAAGTAEATHVKGSADRRPVPDPGS